MCCGPSWRSLERSVSEVVTSTDAETPQTPPSQRFLPADVTPNHDSQPAATAGYTARRGGRARGGRVGGSAANRRLRGHGRVRPVPDLPVARRTRIVPPDRVRRHHRHRLRCRRDSRGSVALRAVSAAGGADRDPRADPRCRPDQRGWVRAGHRDGAVRGGRRGVGSTGRARARGGGAAARTRTRRVHVPRVRAPLSTGFGRSRRLRCGPGGVPRHPDAAPRADARDAVLDLRPAGGGDGRGRPCSHSWCFGP